MCDKHQSIFKSRNAITVKCMYPSSQQWTPLHFAARKGRKHTAESLVKKGANININDNNEVTKCDYANMVDWY